MTGDYGVGYGIGFVIAGVLFMLIVIYGKKKSKDK